MEGYCMAKKSRGAALTRATSVLTDAADAVKRLATDPDACVAGRARAVLYTVDRLCAAIDRAAEHSEAVALALAPVAPTCPVHERDMVAAGAGWSCRAGRCQRRARVEDNGRVALFEEAAWWPPLSS
jgi:hypothetical protein